jgi:aromatic ring-opening dioxygenase LigB subunit
VRADDAPLFAPSRGIVFACIAPHGDLAIPEACPPERAGLAIRTQAGMRELAGRLDAADPDVVVVLTPHGIHVERHFAVVVAGRLAGALEEAPGVALDVPVDRELALATLEELRAGGLAEVGVSFGGNDPAEAAMPLDWGTLVPLWYLGGRRTPPRPVVVVAPARDLPVDAHVAAGRAIAHAVARSGRRATLVASADQSHTHLASGPYGFDPAARVVDDLMVAMIRDGGLDALPGLDPELVEAAKPDSWWQMLMLLGAIGPAWTPVLHSYETPTYYGMLCASFDPPR